MTNEKRGGSVGLITKEPPVSNIFDWIDKTISDMLLREEMLLEEKGATEEEIVAHRKIRKDELNTWAKGVLSELEVARQESSHDAQPAANDNANVFSKPISDLYGPDAQQHLIDIGAEFGIRAQYEVEVFLRSLAHVTALIGRYPTKEEQKAIFDVVKRNTAGRF
ncbi:hypothetical protein ABE527_14660 [Brucella sp. TWI432]